jgi:hypothetical protein
MRAAINSNASCWHLTTLCYVVFAHMVEPLIVV